MSLLISILYAPIVFVALKFFNINIVSILLFFLSLIWFFYTWEKDRKNIVFPLFYLTTAVICFFIQEFLILKALPLFISIFIFLIFLISFLKKESIILSFVQKLAKKEFSKEEINYIQKSTFFWLLILNLNLFLHLWALVSSNINFWLFYSSIGGYLLIIIAGVIQYLHKKFIFNPRQKVVK